MATEQEWKLSVPDAETLDRILAWEGIQRLLAEAPRLYRMKTTYYDAPDRRFSAKHITLRRRMENESSVLCVKAPLDGPDPAGGGKRRGEWELEGEDLNAALPRLAELGAPAELLDVPPLIPVCGAEFVRRAALLRFDDGSACELALDLGQLSGSRETLPLCELELELKEGAPAATLELLRRLTARFSLAVQPLSKYARAKSLG